MTEKRRKKRLMVLPLVICAMIVIAMAIFMFHEYRQIVFEHISKFTQVLIANNPDQEQEILNSLKEYHAYSESEIKSNTFLNQYGYRSNDFFEGISFVYSVLFIMAAFIIGGGFLVSFWIYDKHNKQRITELTEYLEKVNTDTPGTVVQVREDDFSHLQDELYKTVTALYQTREAAVVAKENFADNLANIAHQIKTPITAAFLSLQLLEKEMSNSRAAQIRKQLERLNRLEESLLMLSKIDAGTLHLDMASVDVYTALSLAAENLSDLLQREDVSVQIPDKGCMEIPGDLEWTMEALMNLIKNCSEHSPKGGTVHCDYSSNPLYTEIRIWDEGNGFEPTDLSHLFERFYRGKNAADGGIGIGLSLAKAIFELENGNITACNLPKGGACFEIRVYSH